MSFNSSTNVSRNSFIIHLSWVGFPLINSLTHLNGEIRSYNGVITQIASSFGRFLLQSAGLWLDDTSRAEHYSEMSLVRGRFQLVSQILNKLTLQVIFTLSARYI